MTDPVETLIRAAGARDVADLDVGSIRARARRRTRARRVRRAVAVAITAALAAAAVVLVTAGPGDRRREVDTTGALPTFTRTPGIPGSYQVGAITSDGHAYVATGFAIDPATQPPNQGLRAAIWYSTDGASWQLVHSDPPAAIPPTGHKGDPPPPPTVAAATIGEVVATAKGFIAIGSRGVAGVDGSVAAVWHSDDGITWTAAENAQFLPAATGHRSISSAIEDVVERNGQLLGVGEIFTHSTAPDGGRPCIWTSSDGLRWAHRIVDLGPGFDPYFTRLAVRGNTVVTTGRVGKYPAISWTSRDLTHWKRTTIASQASATLVDTTRGLFAVGALRHSASLRDQKTRPAIWRSTDGTHWRRVLTLATGELAYFSQLASDGDTLLATGGPLAPRRPTAPYVYSSADGLHWHRLALHFDVFPEKSAPRDISFQRTAVNTVGVIGGRLVFVGTVANNGGPLATSAPYIWRADS